ncbi:MAG: response regulator transcription factor [Gammaproteobacteria bacterium]|nr:response regulator transcription factor [Gammaproteobacteria bacterium]MCP4090256.1 response regulator transcription factor [Gammaproteobacteria bacterium]MCP4276327.1 response regulator transcription factor [Gammaproteobacteria bacterium]MCP4831200.1 response regulator transcription factor [Gammaproteobacteria bacterium]MCP4930128.1 response regulator transcription factor [Gammaproteobacteria bacterium]
MSGGELKMLIVDDEALARTRLSAMVSDIGGWSVIAEAANGMEALELCQQERLDVVLLDIRMPGMDGIEVAAHLCGLEVPPAIIFTTAYDEYAVKAFEIHAVGYLLKPVRRERLMRVLEQAAKLGRLKLAQLTESNPELGLRQRISVSQVGKMIFVPTETVIAFCADQKYVRMFYEVDGELKEGLIDDPLKVLEKEFAADFVRIHRNSLVRLGAIELVERAEGTQQQVRLCGMKQPLAVSRRHISVLKQRLQN